jgi:cholesterol oxidase
LKKDQKFDYDYIIIGSGFGGSVAALRLSEKGYSVLVLEKGKWLKEADFPKTNWNVKRWLWMPFFRFFGLFRLTFFRHVAVLSGVGVGGGSLVYANTMPIPKKEFFKADTWSHLADWEKELEPFYQLALKMRGAAQCPRLETGDLALKQLADEIGKADQFSPTTVAVYFGHPEERVADPYFGGEGPDRVGCKFCGGCMTGCRYNSKNTLDKNYLHLAQKNGAMIQAESEVYDVSPTNVQDGSNGYRIKWKASTTLFRKRGECTARGIVFAGGVLGTVDLMLKLKKTSLPRLSDRLGSGVRTNSESLVGVTTFDKDKNFSEGVAISAILNTDAHSHLEPVRYSAGSGIWRLLMSPMISGGSILARILKLIFDLLLHPIKNFRAFTVDDWSKRTQILLFMRTIDSTLRFRQGLFGLKSIMDTGDPPTAFIPESRELAEKYARIINGKPMVLLTETLFGIPTTAHILGGAVMGRDITEGVIDKDNRVFGYENMYVCDGSMISANIGVNPSLTITALSERAMGKVPPKS